ncbi:hypothetical protein GALL_203530 [mine drainage metagenome]|uniref:TniQ domain-containing protein n=1 Tax=mine drainage metagenome TaxID=410659 RepID=A0A1J5RPS0_9ZZZZ
MTLLADIGDPDFGAPTPIPPRSRLFSLPPIGVGTPRQESLLSFIVRTSRAHAVNPRGLIHQVFVESEPAIGKLAYAGFYKRFAGTINGLGKYAEQFVATMEHLTGQTSLGHLTLLQWKDVFPHNGQGLLSRYPRWCPICLWQRRQQGEETYFPLAWAMETYRVCDAHHRPLEDRCPHCEKQQPFVPRYPDLGICDYCQRPLVNEASVGGGNRERPANRLELWVADAVGDMLLRQSQQGFAPTVARFRDFVLQQVRVSNGGNRAAFCRALGFDTHGLNGWLDKQQRPSITQFLAFCHGVTVMPPDIFSEDLPQACEQPSRPVEKLKDRASCPRPTRERLRRMKEHLDASMASTDCRPVASIAANLGVGPSCLRYWFPDLCRALGERHRSVVKERAAVNLVLQRARVQEVVRKILANGEYPSRRRVNNVLHHEHMSLALPHLLNAYLKALHER